MHARVPRPKTFVQTLAKLIASIVLFTLAHVNAHADDAKPEGTLGWWYYINIYQDGYASDPVTACQNTAKNHMGKPLLAMRPGPVSAPMYYCLYKHFVVGPPFWYGSTTLRCQPGYVARWPGVCTKQSEAAQPPDCSAGQPGFAVGNPVIVSSGAKVQSETDLTAGPDSRLQVRRTYRSLRQLGEGQSGGQGWSFWFDLRLQNSLLTRGTPPSTMSFMLPDGSDAVFSRVRENYLSDVNKTHKLQAIDPNFDEWVLSTAGRVDRFKLVKRQVQLISTHTQDGHAQFYARDADGRLQTVSDEYGRQLKIHWSGDVVEAISGPDGSVRYEYLRRESPGASLTPGTEKLIAVTFYDADGNELAKRQYHHEDPHNPYLLTGVTDENGVRFATYEYNDQGQVVLSEHAGGANRHTFSYPDKTSRIVTDPLDTERKIGIGYLRSRGTTTGRVTSASQPGGAGCGPSNSKFTYDHAGLMTSSTDFGGQKTCYIHDPIRGLETTQVAGLGANATCPGGALAPIDSSSRRISTEWHPDWALKTRVALPLQITSYVYNGQADIDGKILSCAQDATLPGGKPIAVLCKKSVTATLDQNGSAGFAAKASGAARVWQYRYNRTGQLVSTTGPRNAKGQSATINYTYYADTTIGHTRGDLHKMTDAAGGVTEFLDYSASGQAQEIRLADGQSVTLEYDGRQRLVSKKIENTDSVVAHSRYEYSATGQLARITMPDGSAISYAYDDAHRLTRLEDNAGNSIEFSLDAMGNVLAQEIRDPDGNLVRQTRHSFDALNRRQRDQRAPDDPGLVYGYDTAGNLTRLTDALGRVTTIEYDHFNRKIREILPAQMTGAPSPSIGFAYNHQDQMTQVVDPRNLQTRYLVDGFGQQTSIDSPDTGVATRQFDDAGNLVQQRDARGATSQYHFDAAQRLTQRAEADGSRTSFAYGEPGSGAAGRVTGMIDPSGSTRYTYDTSGKLRAQTRTSRTGNKTFTLGYEYGNSSSSFGHASSMTYPSGNRIEMNHDSNGRISSLTLVAPGSAATAIVSQIAYVPFGPARAWSWGSAKHRYQRTFDLAGRLINYPLGHPDHGGSIRTVHHDAEGKPTSTSHAGGQLAARLDQTYSYNGLDQLTGYVAATASQRFDYDANGNRTQFSLGATTFFNQIDSASNRLASTSGPYPAKKNHFDAAGNLLGDGTIEYGYSAAGRMASAKNRGVATSYEYDGLGQRVVKRRGGEVTYYVYDAQAHLIGEYDVHGMAIQETVYLGDLPIAVLKPGGAGTALYYIYADHLNTPRVITRATDEQIVWRWDSADPFGLDQPDDNPSGTGKFSYNLRFPGQVFDKETNNHYNYYRDYDPQTGRYVQSDPIGLAGGMNTYRYAGSNPISMVDPYGLFELLAFPQNTVNFFAGMGDVMLFGTGAALRNAIDVSGGIDTCSNAYGAGEWAGVGASIATGFVGGVKAAGTKAAGKEFSHWIPNRVGGPRSIWNGNFVTPARHYYHDPFRYPRGWRDLGSKWPSPVQQFDRIPNVYKGSVAGAAVGWTVTRANGCGCQ